MPTKVLHLTGLREQALQLNTRYARFSRAGKTRSICFVLWLLQKGEINSHLFKKATGKLRRTLWSLSQTTTLFIREEIRASIVKVFYYSVLELQHIKDFKVCSSS